MKLNKRWNVLLSNYSGKWLKTLTGKFLRGFHQSYMRTDEWTCKVWLADHTVNYPPSLHAQVKSEKCINNNSLHSVGKHTRTLVSVDIICTVQRGERLFVSVAGRGKLWECDMWHEKHVTRDMWHVTWKTCDASRPIQRERKDFINC